MSTTDDTADESNEKFLTPTAPPNESLDSLVGAPAIREKLTHNLLEPVQKDVSLRYRPNSLLVHGPAGAGKRELVEAVVGELGTMGYRYDIVETYPRPHTEHATTIDELLEEASAREPLVLVVDFFGDVHGLGDARSFKNALERIRYTSDVMVIAVADEEELWETWMDAYFRAADLTVEVSLPDRERRRAVLEAELELAGGEGELVVDVDRLDLDELAIETQQFAIDDLRTAVKRAVTDATVDGDVATFAQSDLLGAIDAVGDERLDQVRSERWAQHFETPDTTWDDVGGHEAVKRRLKESVQQPQEWQEAYEQWDLERSRGILLHGPPGTGKTLLVRALANESDRTFIPVQVPSLKNPAYGDPAKHLKWIFEQAERNAPSIVFFDEVDAIGGRRGVVDGRSEDAVNALLTELSGVGDMGDVLVVAATNRPEALDEALLRPGRFDDHIEVPYPDDGTRRDIFHIHTRDVPLAEDVRAEWFVNAADDLSGADIATICDRAAGIALRRTDAETHADVMVARADFERAFEETQSHRLSVGEGELTPTFQ